jgi:uncharacterized protein (DUF1800 family)
MRRTTTTLACLVLSMLGACGGGSAPEATEGQSANSQVQGAVRTAAQAITSFFGESAELATGAITASLSADTIGAAEITASDASLFLGQASFGATAFEINNVMALGADGWLNAQFDVNPSRHRLYMDQAATRLAAGANLNEGHFYQSFWKHTISGSDHLRQRLVYALSQIFVVSFQDGALAVYPRGVACYYDTLGTNVFGNFRQLLEGVATSPMMGLYLSHLGNRPETETSVPDENFAREIMQLMTIGLYELNQDGSRKLSGGQPIPTYTHDDVAGLAKVFTGWSWGGGDGSDYAFTGDTHYLPADRDCRAMENYGSYHSVSEKKFLGTQLSAGGTGSSDLKDALDTLFNHPNVGPFIGRQLIQRLVTSNPSPAYISRVAAAFNNNGSGVRGDMKAVIRAILLDTEARNPVLTQRSGKLREPVLRLANWLRAFNATSQSGNYLIWNLEDPLNGIGQNPLRSPSVFNFFRPNYSPPNTALSDAGLTAPEMQIANDTAVIGYLNFMGLAIPKGIGSNLDIRPYYGAELSIDDNDLLVDRINLLLLGGRMSATLHDQIRTTLDRIIVVTNSENNTAAAAQANRVYMAIYLTMASPEYLVQK